MLEKTITTGGFTTRYVEDGPPDGTPVLLLHDGAWGGSGSTSWNNLIPLLAEKYRVLAPDLLGFGGTDKAVFLDRASYDPRIEHVRAFLDELNLGPVHAVGTSFGGSLALRMLASADGGSLRSVTSVNGTGGPWRTPFGLAELGHWDGTRADLGRIVDALIDDFPGRDAHLDERFRWASAPGHYRAMMAVSVPLPEGLSGAKAIDQWPEQLAGATTPILLVAGIRDELVEPEWTARLAAVAPHARVEQLHCKHEPNIDKPNELFAVLDNFFRSLNSGEA